MPEKFHPKPTEVIAERVRDGSSPGNRNDGYKVAQIYQGGSMKVALAAGAAIAQRELFWDKIPIDRFDGTSSGVPPWMYMMAGSRHAEGMTIPYDELSRGFIRLRNLLTVGKIVNLDLMNDAFREGYKALDFEAILHHPTETHVYATSAADGKVVDFQVGEHALKQERGAQLHNNEYVFFCHTAEDVAKAIASTTLLPFFGGKPVVIDEKLACFDGGISAAGRLPLRRAIKSGASHILVFTTEKSTFKRTKSPEEKFAAWWLKRHHPGILDYWAGHNEHLQTLNLLKLADSSEGKLPLVEVISVPDEDIPGSKETRREVIYRATLAGRAAMLKAFESYDLPMDDSVSLIKPKCKKNT